jgi:hypothetical protein
LPFDAAYFDAAYFDTAYFDTRSLGVGDRVTNLYSDLNAAIDRYRQAARRQNLEIVALKNERDRLAGNIRVLQGKPPATDAKMRAKEESLIKQWQGTLDNLIRNNDRFTATLINGSDDAGRARQDAILALNALGIFFDSKKKEARAQEKYTKMKRFCMDLCTEFEKYCTATYDWRGDLTALKKI